MTQSAKVQEPSMEEILASIRRIIADDETPAPARQEPVPAPQTPPQTSSGAKPGMNQTDIDAMLAGFDSQPGHLPPADDILDLTESTATADNSNPADPRFRTIDGQPDVIFREGGPAGERSPRPEPRPMPPTSAQAPQTAAPFTPKPRAAPPPESSLISSNTSAAVDTAFHSLAHTAVSHDPRTLEDIVREMLKPMLKTWLDENLPDMVERLVRAEIERVSRLRR